MKKVFGVFLSIIFFYALSSIFTQPVYAVATCSCNDLTLNQWTTFTCKQPRNDNNFYRTITCSVRKSGLPLGVSCSNPRPTYVVGDLQPLEGAIDTSVHTAPPVQPYGNCWDTDIYRTTGCGGVPFGCDQGFVGNPNYFIPQSCLEYADATCGLIPCSCRGYYSYRGCNQCGGNPTCLATEGICRVHHGNLCFNVPCNCKNQCGCSNTACPSPTPLPTPFCALSCFGISGQGGDLGLGGGGGTPAPTVMPPLISGTIDFEGYNGFECGTYKDGMWYDGPCPTPPGGGGGAGFGRTSQWSSNARYNMLCGGSNFTYTASVDDLVADRGGGGGGGLGEPTATPGGPTPTPQLYPQGCDPNLTPTPTPTGGGGGLGGGSKGGTSTSTSCSCNVTLSCQSTLAPKPSDTGVGCSPTCNFAVNPDYPLFDNATAFYTIENTPSTNITFSFDDGSANVSNQQSVNHTFVNAGVYDVALSCSDTAETCTRRVNSYCDNGVAPTATPTSTPTPSPTPNSTPWFKVKDADFTSRDTLSNVIPSTVTAYDADDTGNPDCGGQAGGANIRCFSLNQSGLVIAKNAIDFGGAPASNRAWQLDSYTLKNHIDASSYVDYIASRKKPKPITSIDSTIDTGEIQKNYINVITGDYTISDSAVTTQAPYVLVVKGDLTIDIDGTFGSTGNAIAIFVTGTLNITSRTKELNGIFIANNLDVASNVETGSTTPNPLKIKGNISIANATTTLPKRARIDDNTKPSVFVVFDAMPYKDTLPLLSVRTYEWEELTP